MDQAIEMFKRWCEQQLIEGMEIEIVRISDHAPFLFIEIPGTSDDVVLQYGHYDKRPELTGWEETLDPWKPVIRDGKLYDRGGADDGYATFGSHLSMSVSAPERPVYARLAPLRWYDNAGG